MEVGVWEEMRPHLWEAISSENEIYKALEDVCRQIIGGETDKALEVGWRSKSLVGATKMLKYIVISTRYGCQ
jgi:hypothetical protein